MKERLINMKDRNRYEFHYIVEGKFFKSRVFITSNPDRLSRVLAREFNSSKEFIIEYKIK